MVELMDNTGLGSRFLSGLSGDMLDLELPINRNQEFQLNNLAINHSHNVDMISGLGLGLGHHPMGLMESRNTNSNGISMSFNKAKGISLTNNKDTSDEDEPNFVAEDANGEYGDERKRAQWHRMKWTNDVIRLLIAVVACVGDDGSLDSVDGVRRKSGILSKKGKWKTIANIMIGKGCSVSPQQCEDKFNDLNKRYKRLNEILGRGTSCRVVENPALMDSMPNLSSKMKDVVKKILCSKHLFYQEMCAYHNDQKIPNCHELDLQVFSAPTVKSTVDHHESEEDEPDEDDDSDDNHLDCNIDHTVEDNMERVRKRKSLNEDDDRLWPHSVALDNMEAEMAVVLHDPTKALAEKREWIKNKMLQLLEQRVNIQAEAVEIENRHLKWLSYRHKKDREFMRLKLENERQKLENQRLELLMHEKQQELDYKPPHEA